MSCGLWGVNTIGLLDSLVCASHSFWLSIMFLMRLIITTVLGGRSVQRLRFALISLICSLWERGENLHEWLPLVRVETELSQSPKDTMRLIPRRISNCATGIHSLLGFTLTMVGKVITWTDLNHSNRQLKTKQKTRPPENASLYDHLFHLTCLFFVCRALYQMWDS